MWEAGRTENIQTSHSCEIRIDLVFTNRISAGEKSTLLGLGVSREACGRGGNKYQKASLWLTHQWSRIFQRIGKLPQ